MRTQHTHMVLTVSYLLVQTMTMTFKEENQRRLEIEEEDSS